MTITIANVECSTFILQRIAIIKATEILAIMFLSLIVNHVMIYDLNLVK